MRPKMKMSMHANERRIRIGDERTGIVEVGGAAPVALQTMTTSFTHDVEASVAEINRLHAAGVDIVRVAVPEERHRGAPEILSRTNVPIVADVHFHFKRALGAVEAGVHKIRLNPGNISDRVQVEAVMMRAKTAAFPFALA